jgi:hypothetical protein
MLIDNYSLTQYTNVFLNLPSLTIESIFMG